MCPSASDDERDVLRQDARMTFRFGAVLAAMSLVACSKDEQQVEAVDIGVEVAVEDTTPPAPVFAKGPYGTHPRDVAGPFVAPTTDGDWSFEEKFTGEDHYLFVAYQSTNAY
jgi:hypothetical protein